MKKLEEKFRNLVDSTNDDGFTSLEHTESRMTDCAEITEQECIGFAEEHKIIIKKLLDIYVLNIDENGLPRTSIHDIMDTLNKAAELIKTK